MTAQSAPSAVGSAADGVLGCYNGAADEITLLEGWNWYAGADPTQIGSGQYDFQTTVAHELGHALGLGGSADPNSPMDETLPSGVARRTMTVADLNIPYPPEGADPLRAAGAFADPATGPSSATAPALPLAGGAGRTPVLTVPVFSFTVTALPSSGDLGPASPGTASFARGDRLAEPTAVPLGGTDFRLPFSAIGRDVGPHSGTADDPNAPAPTPGGPWFDEPSPEFLDRLFQDESALPGERDVLPRNGESQGMAEQLALLLADSRGPGPKHLGQLEDGTVGASMRGGPAPAETLDRLAGIDSFWSDAFAPDRVAVPLWEEGVPSRGNLDAAPDAQTGLGGLAAALLVAYGLTQSKQGESRRRW